MEAVKNMEAEAPIHGGDRLGAARKSGLLEQDILDFSVNVNPLGMPPGVKEAVLRSIEEAQHYPDPLCRRLREEIARTEGRAAEEILCGNGGADLIYRMAYALRPRRVLVTAPSFAEYEEASRQAGARVEVWEPGGSPELGEDFLQALHGDLDLVFLCNPNNPTGLLTGRELLEAVLKRARELGIRVCVDECFLDFVRGRKRYTVEGLVEEYPNLVILRSFTKLYAMPGLRLGYLISSDRAFLEKIRLAGQPWAVSALAQAAGIAALKEKDFSRQTVETVERERVWMRERLLEFGFEVFDGQANYLCFRAPGEEELQERLLRQGILIRSCSNYRGLTGEHYRAAVRTREENERLMQALKERR